MAGRRKRRSNVERLAEESNAKCRRKCGYDCR